MASFNEDGLKKKLDDLNMSQQSIQTVSLWLIHHKKHAHTVVNVWYRELVIATDSRKLTFMYLANDVIQNSKKKGPEYNKEFGNKLGKVFDHLGGLRLDEKSTRGFNRLLTVWEERNVFDEEKIALYNKNFNKENTNTKEKSKKREHSTHGSSKSKKHKKDSELNSHLFYLPGKVESSKRKKHKQSKESKRKHRKVVVVEEEEEEEEPVVEEAPRIRRDSEMTVHSPQASTPPTEPPEPEQLIEALQELESAATSDAAVREKIASLPDEVSDVTLLNNLEDLTAAHSLSEKVEDALSMLEIYNKRLSEEMEARKSVARMLHDYITYQKDLLAQAEETLEEHRQKQGKVKKVREELKAHLQNLPDISKLPNIRTGGLAPLPSAGDLFT